MVQIRMAQKQTELYLVLKKQISMVTQPELLEYPKKPFWEDVSRFQAQIIF
jgi:hypothetical protein